MIYSFNSRFPVSGDFDRHSFFFILCSWLKGRAGFDSVAIENFASFDFKSDDIRVSSIDDSEKIDVSNYTERFIVSHTLTESDAIFKTHYVLDDVSDSKEMVVYQERYSLSAQLRFDESHKDTHFDIPDLMQYIFWNECGGNDNGLIVSNMPHMLRKSDVDFARNIITGSVVTYLPVIYVSSHCDSCDHALDYKYLAEALAGQAHVVVDSSPIVSSLVLNSLANSDCRRPYDGSIQVYSREEITVVHEDDSGADLPDLFNHNGYVDSDDVGNIFIDALHRMFCSMAIDETFDQNKLRQEHALAKFAKDTELSEIFESMIADKQKDIDALKSELADSKKQYADLKMKTDALESQLVLAKASNNIGDNITIDITEKDLYDNEIKTVVLNVLQSEKDRIKDDPVLNKSRKYDILSDILDHNFPCTTGAVLVGCLRDAFKDGSLTRDGIGRLQSSGFTVVKGGDHYKIYIGDETRYFVTVSSTSSDKKRGYLNAVSDFSNKLFG